MKIAQIYCTTGEVIADLSLPGEEPKLSDRVWSASRALQSQFPGFLPVLKTRTLRGSHARELNPGAPLLSVTSVTLDGALVSDYSLRSHEGSDPCWPNGPYTWLERHAGWGHEHSEVVITGWWGMYDERADLALTATQLAADQVITVADGSRLSAGMLVAIEDEQELVTGIGDPSPATSGLSGGVAAGDELITVDDGAEFYAGEVLLIGTEDIGILKRAGDQLVVRRGYNGTTIGDHADDSPIAVYRAYRVARGVNGTTAADHMDADLERVLAPSDLNYLCRQVAALMREKAKTNFAGRAGGPEGGEAFFVNEFPRQIATIQENYAIPYF